MALGIILFVIALVLAYSVICWTPGKESRKEEKQNDSK